MSTPRLSSTYLDAHYKTYMLIKLTKIPYLNPKQLFDLIAEEFPDEPAFYDATHSRQVLVAIRNHMAYIKRFKIRRDAVYNIAAAGRSMPTSLDFVTRNDIHAHLPIICYDCNKNYDTIEKLKDDFGSPKNDHVFTLPVTEEDLIAVGATDSQRNVLLQSIVFFGIGNLWNLYTFLEKINHGNKRMISIDGTYNILNTRNQTLISMGAVVVDSPPS